MAEKEPYARRHFICFLIVETPGPVPDDDLLGDSPPDCTLKIVPAFQHRGVMLSPVFPSPKPPDELAQERYQASHKEQQRQNHAASEHPLVPLIHQVPSLPPGNRTVQHCRPKFSTVEQAYMIMSYIRHRVPIDLFGSFQILQHLVHPGKFFAVRPHESFQLCNITPVALHERASHQSFEY